MTIPKFYHKVDCITLPFYFGISTETKISSTYRRPCPKGRVIKKERTVRVKLPLFIHRSRRLEFSLRCFLLISSYFSFHLSLSSSLSLSLVILSRRYKIGSIWVRAKYSHLSLSFSLNLSRSSKAIVRLSYVKYCFSKSL